MNETAQLIISGSLQGAQVIERDPNVVIEDLALDDDDEEVVDGDRFILDAVEHVVLDDVVVLVELELKDPVFDGL